MVWALLTIIIVAPKMMLKICGDLLLNEDFSLLNNKLVKGGSMYAIILAVVAPINSKSAPRLHVVNDTDIVPNTKTVVIMKCSFVERIAGSQLVDICF